MTPAAESFAALVGTRAAVLGIADLSAASLPGPQRRFVLRLLATVDGVDAVTGTVRAQRLGRLSPVLIGALPGLLSVYLRLAAANR